MEASDRVVLKRLAHVDAKAPGWGAAVERVGKVARRQLCVCVCAARRVQTGCRPLPALSVLAIFLPLSGVFGAGFLCLVTAPVTTVLGASAPRGFCFPSDVARWRETSTRLSAPLSRTHFATRLRPPYNSSLRRPTSRHRAASPGTTSGVRRARGE